MSGRRTGVGTVKALKAISCNVCPRVGCLSSRKAASIPQDVGDRSTHDWSLPPRVYLWSPM